MRDLTEIAVGFDASPQGLDGLRLGELLARTVGVQLLVVRVQTGRGGNDSGGEAELESDLAQALAGSTVSRRARLVRRRSPDKALAELAAAEPAIGLIALGSTHRAGIGRVLPGGVAEHLLAGAPCSIAVAPRGYGGSSPPEPADPPRVIAVGYDGSPESEAALELARSLAEAAEATVRVIAVGQPQAAAWDAGQTAAGAAAAPALDLQSRLHEAVARLPSELRALPIYERGMAARHLLEHAEEGVDLLIMGSRGHGPLGATLLGSTTRVVFDACPCPVVVVPRPAIAPPS